MCGITGWVDFARDLTHDLLDERNPRPFEADESVARHGDAGQADVGRAQLIDGPILLDRHARRRPVHQEQAHAILGILADLLPGTLLGLDQLLQRRAALGDGVLLHDQPVAHEVEAGQLVLTG